jgi:hypothetical protein
MQYTYFDNNENEKNNNKKITFKQKQHLKYLLNNSKIYKENNVTYYKVLSENFLHNTFQFKLGENILKQHFNQDVHYCCDGGFYFCKLEDVCKWLTYKYNLNYICEVELCPDSIVVAGQDKLKTNKFILKNKLDIGTFLEKHNLESEAYAINRANLKFIGVFGRLRLFAPILVISISLFLFVFILILIL